LLYLNKNQKTEELKEKIYRILKESNINNKIIFNYNKDLLIEKLSNFYIFIKKNNIHLNEMLSEQIKNQIQQGYQMLEEIYNIDLIKQLKKVGILNKEFLKMYYGKINMRDRIVASRKLGIWYNIFQEHLFIIIDLFEFLDGQVNIENIHSRVP
jgi:hypothetical protein